MERTHFLQKGSYGTTNVENLALWPERDVTAHEFFLLAIVTIHHPVEKTSERAPAFLFSVGDVLVIVEGLNVIEVKPRVLIPKSATCARDKCECPGSTGEIVLSRKKGCRFCGLAVVTGDSLKMRSRRSEFKSCTYLQNISCHHRKPPIESIIRGRPARSPISATKIHRAPRDSRTVRS